MSNEMRCYIISAVTDGDGGKIFWQFIVTSTTPAEKIVEKFTGDMEKAGRSVQGSVMCTEVAKEEIASVYNALQGKAHSCVERTEGNVVYVDFSRKVRR